MRWFLLTLALLACSAGLLGWIYVRDRDTHWRPPEPQLASAAAEGALSELGGAGCSAGCSSEVLANPAPHRWLARLSIRGRTICVLIDLQTFNLHGPDAPVGVEPHRCPPANTPTAWGPRRQRRRVLTSDTATRSKTGSWSWCSSRRESAATTPRSASSEAGRCRRKSGRGPSDQLGP